MRAFAALAAVAAAAAAGPAISVSVDATGAYAVNLDDVPWFTSAPTGGYGASFNGVMHTSGSGGGLTMDGAPTAVAGTDALGIFTGYNVSWSGGVFLTGFRQYRGINAVVYTQTFPAGMTGTKLDVSKPYEDLATAFPAFGTPAASLNTPLGYLTWANTMCGGHPGQWNAKGVDTGAFGREGGPVAFFNSTLATIVMSPLNNFMVASSAFANSVGGVFASGLNGMVDGIPAGFEHSVIMVGGQSVNDTMYAWGDILLQVGGKERTKPDADLVVSKLSYWSDNGAYYYYLTEPNKTYEQTMLDVKQYTMTDLSLPIAYFQYDSWWYYKNATSGAVTLWEPRPDVFPDGLAPWLGLPTVLHNRYFSSYNNYSDMGYQFLTEPTSDLALPIDKRMFKYIMNKTQVSWVMVQYEQDWLVTVYEGLNVTQSNVTAAHTWLMSMNDAAAELGLTIQMCMALPRHMLHSTLMQTVTNSRASGDYHPGANNWEIEQTSLFYWAVGVAPSKDDWWTTEVQPGSPYTGASEPNWQLQAITIGLSTGPNGISDSIGHTNASLVMSTCNGAGTTLQPSRPAIVMDSALLGVFAGGVPNVRSTWSHHAEHSLRWQYVLAADLQSPFTVKFEDLGPSLAATTYHVVDWFNAGAGAVQALDSSNPFTIAVGQGQPAAPSAAHPIRYYVAAPVMASGWVLYGEAGKVVPMSSQRIDHVVVTATGFTASVLSTANEAGPTYLMWKAATPFAVIQTTCPANQLATLTCGATECICA